MPASQAPASAGALVYPFETPNWDQPAEIRPGIWWLRTRLPFALDHINIWLVDGAEGWTIIDTGVNDEPTRALWEGLLGGMLASRPIRRLLVTHFHPDHSGLAGWLAERTGAEFMMPRIEWLMARMLGLDESQGFVEAGVAFDRAADLPAALVEQRRGRGNQYRRSVVPVPPSYRRIVEGEIIGLADARFRVLIGEGHAPEMVTLYAAEHRLLICADQLLPRISPVIGVWPHMPDADPLAAFVASNRQFRSLPDDTLVLPSHGRPYLGLPRRLDQLAAHHENRLGRAVEACARGASVYEIIPSLFDRTIGEKEIGFALAETVAHLNYLLGRGELVREVDGGGVWRYRPARARSSG